MKQAFRLFALGCMGGMLYGALELVWRGYTHPSMVTLGGVCFVLLGLINEWLRWDTPFWLQCLIGAAIITAAEFAAGCVVNLWWGLAVWDYTRKPLNLLGQVCAEYTGWWILLSGVGIWLDDVARWLLFGDPKPKYKWW